MSRRPVNRWTRPPSDGAEVDIYEVTYGGLSLEGVSLEDVREADTVYVSGFVASALPSCHGDVPEALQDGDVLTSGETLRDDDGQILGILDVETA